MATLGGAPAGAAVDAVYRRLTLRLMPLLCACIILNYLDRTSLSFASIQMTQQLGFAPEVLGLGGGLFFLTYCLMQVGAVGNVVSCRHACGAAVRTVTPLCHVAPGAHQLTCAAPPPPRQVPSNLLCMRVGVVAWLTGLMAVWGAVACLFAAMRTSSQFYALRLLLGLSEAGSFPAM
jgi:hypothetical protein